MEGETLMNNSRFFAAAGAVLALCTLVLTGCTHEAPKAVVDPRLAGNWENGNKNELKGLYKGFTISADDTFTASVNPVHIIAYNTAYSASKAANSSEDAAITAGMTELAKMAGTDGDTRWTVTGKLTSDGDNFYRMNDLTETTNKPVPGDTTPGGANMAVKRMNAKQVKISFSGDGTFTFSPASAGDAPTIGLFFGGTYTRKAP
jgi:hypothetical protein